MKNSYILILILGILFAGVSCEKEMIDVDLTANSWKVEKIQRSGSSSFEATDSTYVLKFESDSTLSIGLDVNTCFGYFSIPQAGNIEISTLACTEICCDSEYAEALIKILRDVTDYYVKGDELHLEGDGKIVFKELKNMTCYDTPPTDEMCTAYFERWFYNESTNSCEKIGYSGCSQYGFETQEECEKCRRD
ncbi:MAG: BPTI/Kunitz domain-containing protein [Bacteroidota bacterium]